MNLEWIKLVNVIDMKVVSYPGLVIPWKGKYLLLSLEPKKDEVGIWAWDENPNKAFTIKSEPDLKHGKEYIKTILEKLK